MRMGRLWTLPELSHIEPNDGGQSRYFSVEGITGIGYRIPLVDLEDKEREVRFQGIFDLVKAIPEGQWVKFCLNVNQEPKTPDVELSRSASVKSLGGVTKELRVFFESEVSTPIFRKKCIIRCPSQEVLKALSAEPLSEAETEASFHFNDAERVSGKNLDFGTEVIGLIRLKKSGNDMIDWETLARVQDELPQPFSITCSIKALSSAKVDFWLRGKMNRDQFSNDVTAQDKAQATGDALRELSLHGSSIYEWEWTLSLNRRSEEILRRDLESAQRVLGKIGEAYVETIGGIPSYAASKPGSPLHVTQKEGFPTVLYYLPVCAFGEGAITNKQPRSTTCLLHRLDASVHGLDLFNDRFLAFNTIITGKTGSGKSVFGNALSRALLNDQNLHLIKVDVGGSYRRECSLYGGEEVSFHLDRPSGVDPFAIVGERLTNEKLSVLTELLATLALDEDEETISKGIRGEIERSLKQYFDSKVKTPSLANFLEKFPSLPRIEILRRFGQGGVFENAIRSKEEIASLNRYTYYNFENIHGASNRDYSSGVMAAVIAFVNLEMIRLSQAESRASGKRLVFFCDETKFFIEKNASFFLLTTANFRKFGHAVVLTGQNIEDFYLKKDGQLDRGLILNSPTRIFFEAQSKPDFLKSEFNLSDQHTNILGVYAYRGSEFRQFVLQDDLGTRICRLFLTKREYWEMTSTRTDVDQLDSLKRSAPWLSENQAIEVMLAKEVG